MRRVIRFTKVLACVLIACLSQQVHAQTPVPWPEFRGPYQNGHAPDKSNIPTVWSETKNVKWKTPIPHKGWSSPVIESDTLWITGADEDGTDYYVMGVNAESGKIVYNEHFFHYDSPEALGNTVNGYASPTSAIRDGRLFVHFGSYGTACIDTKTKKVLWKRENLECRHYRGPGSSVVLYEDLLILTFDGIDQQYTIALNIDTADTVWRTDRTTKWDDLDENGKPKRDGDLRKAFSTPVITEVNNQPLLLSIGSCSIFGYEPKTGKELWSMATPGSTPSIRPVLHKGLAYVALGYGTQESRSIKLDGKGVIGDDHVAWKFSEKSQKPDTASPVIVDGLLYVLTDRGIVSCLDAESGEVVWSERIGGNYMASTLYANGHIYCYSKQGKTTVLKAGRTFKVASVNELEEGFMASPAVFGNALFLRTSGFLYRIEE